MKQAIAGVAPPALGEVTVMTVWPTLGATGMGRLLGRLYAIPVGIKFITLGRLIALASIPIALPLFFFTLLPGVQRRYTLTNRRVVIQKGLRAVNDLYVDLDRFDAIDVRVLPGQEWYRAGDLTFKKGNVETFRLEGVSRPETFRQTCLKAQLSHVGVRRAVREAVAV